MTTRTNSTDPATITVIVNGESVAVPQGSTLLAVLAQRDIAAETPGVAVALGDEVIRRTEWGTTPLADGARVEIVTAVQGG